MEIYIEVTGIKLPENQLINLHTHVFPGKKNDKTLSLTRILGEYIPKGMR